MLERSSSISTLENRGSVFTQCFRFLFLEYQPIRFVIDFISSLDNPYILPISRTADRCFINTWLATIAVRSVPYLLKTYCNILSLSSQGKSTSISGISSRSGWIKPSKRSRYLIGST